MDKKSRKKFIKTVTNYLLELGAVEEDFLAYTLSLDTQLGKLHVFIDPAGARERVSSIFTRFDDHERAKKVVDCNPYSGKWNFHEYSSTDVFEVFKTSLERILASK